MPQAANPFDDTLAAPAGVHALQRRGLIATAVALGLGAAGAPRSVRAQTR